MLIALTIIAIVPNVSPPSAAHGITLPSILSLANPLSPPVSEAINSVTQTHRRIDFGVSSSPAAGERLKRVILRWEIPIRTFIRLVVITRGLLFFSSRI